MRGKPLTAVTVRPLFTVFDRDPEDQLTPLANCASQGYYTRYEYFLCAQQASSCAFHRVWSVEYNLWMCVWLGECVLCIMYECVCEQRAEVAILPHLEAAARSPGLRPRHPADCVRRYSTDIGYWCVFLILVWTCLMFQHRDSRVEVCTLCGQPSYF